MSMKTIILADNSYTIRRIVELSFSEEKDIRLFTFENSINLREKLLELRPEIVLVDIKLPEFSGYEVCKFIQENPTLKHTQVFLLKGGFEPIDERLLKGIRFIDIITKPFDSNQLVANIKKLLEDMSAQNPPLMPDDLPTSMPEDFSEIDELPEPDNNLSFLDVKEEVDSVDSIPEPEFGGTPLMYPDDEILPSEEITRAQPEKDLLSPSLEDVDENPFADDIYSTPDDSMGGLTDEEINIKKNIEMQEKELQIGSLTMEALNIKNDIETRKQQLDFNDDLSDLDRENTDTYKLPGEDSSELFPGKNLGVASRPLEDEMEEPDMSFEPMQPSTPEILEEPVIPSEMETESVDDLFAVPDTQFEKPISYDEANDKLFGQDNEIPDIKYEPEPDNSDMMELKPQAIIEEEPTDFTNEPIEEIPGFMEEPMETFLPEKPYSPSYEEEIPEESIATEERTDDSHYGFESETEEQAEPEAYDLIGGYETPEVKGEIPLGEEEAGDQFDEMSYTESPYSAEPVMEEPAMEAPEQARFAEQAPKQGSGIVLTENMFSKIENRLTNAIKEMLWEIIPPLAEKIIKQEIDSLKSEVEKSLK